MSVFIELHQHNKRRLFQVSNISAVVDSVNDCSVYIVGDPEPFDADEDYEEIIEILKKAVQYEL